MKLHPWSLAPAWALAAGLAAATPCVPPAGPGYVDGPRDHRSAVVVFVHGLGGDPQGTWTWTSMRPWVAPVYWPCLVRANPEFDQADLYVHGYQAPALEESASIDQLTGFLIDQLRARGVLRRQHIAIVAHSLGGLLVQRMLVRLAGSSDEGDQAVLERVRLVQFYGVPALGADTAVWAKRISSSRLVAELADAGALQGWLDRWNRIGHRFRRDCLAETRDSGFAVLADRVVPEASAMALCAGGGNLQPLAERDHFQIVKPESADDAPFQWLYAAHAQCLRPRQRTAAPGGGADPAVRRATGWYHGLAADFRNRQIDLRLHAKAEVVQPTPGFGIVRYVRPQPGARGMAADRYAVVNSGDDLALDFAEQFPAYLAGLDLDAVVPVARLPQTVPDPSAPALVAHLLAQQVVAEDDMALVLGPPTPGLGPRMLLLVAMAGDSPRLKGYLLLDRDLGCI